MDIEIVVRGNEWRDPVYTYSTVQASNKTHVLKYYLLITKFERKSMFSITCPDLPYLT